MSPLSTVLRHTAQHAYNVKDLLAAIVEHVGGREKVMAEATSVLVPLACEGDATALQMLKELHGGFGALAEASWLDQVRSLSMTHIGQSDLDEVARFLAAPGLAGVHSLDLSATHYGNELAAILAKAPLDGLTQLRMDKTSMKDKGLRALAKRPTPLRTLSISGNAVSPAGLKSWGKSKTQVALEVLDASGNRLGRNGAGDFLATPGFQRLRELDASDNGNLQDFVLHLHDTIEVLDLSYNTFGGILDLFKKPPAGLKALQFAGVDLPEQLISKSLRGAIWNQLESLSLFNTVGLDATAQVAALFGSAKPQLRSFVAPEHLEDAAFAKVAKGSLRQRLETLELRSCQLSAATLHETLSHLSGLKKLVLDSSPIGDAAAEAVVSLLPNLEVLSLKRTGLTSAGANMLADWDGRSSLQSLHIPDNDIGPSGAQALATALPQGCISSFRELGLGEAGLVALIEAGQLTGEVDLCGNNLTDGAIQALTESPQSNAIASLDLCDNPKLSAASMASIADSDYLQELAVLSSELDQAPVHESPKRSLFLRLQ